MISGLEDLRLSTSANPTKPVQLSLEFQQTDYGEFTKITEAQRLAQLKREILRQQKQSKLGIVPHTKESTLAEIKEDTFTPIDFEHELEKITSGDVITQMLEYAAESYGKPLQLKVSKQLTPSNLEELVRNIIDVENNLLISRAPTEKFDGIEKRLKTGEMLHYLASVVFSHYLAKFQFKDSFSTSHIEISFPEYGHKVLEQKFKKFHDEPELIDEIFVGKEEIQEELKLNPNEFKDSDEMFEAYFGRGGNNLNAQIYHPTLSESFNLVKINHLLQKSEYTKETIDFVLKVLIDFKEYLKSFNPLKEDILFDIREEFHENPGKIIASIIALTKFYDSLDWNNIVTKTGERGENIPQVMFEANIDINCEPRRPDYYNAPFSKVFLNHSSAQLGQDKRDKNKVKELIPKQEVRRKKDEKKKKEKERIPLPEFQGFIDLTGVMFRGDDRIVDIDRRIIHVIRDLEENLRNPLLFVGMKFRVKADMVLLTNENGEEFINVYDFKSSTEYLKNDLGTVLNALSYRIAAANLLLTNTVDPKQEEMMSYFHIELDNPRLLWTIFYRTRFSFVDLKTGKVISNDEIFGDMQYEDLLDLIRIIYKIHETAIVYSDCIDAELKQRKSDQKEYL